MSSATPMEGPLLVHVTRERDGRLRASAPSVGRWSDPPHAGAVVGPGSRVGSVQRLNRRQALILPQDAAGKVEDVPREKIVDLQYGETMFRLVPLTAGDTSSLGDGQRQTAAAGEADLPPGTRAVLAPTDGVFYGRPSPDSAPFVEVGDKLRSGQPVGLVEVMKTFNQILYGGPGLPEEVQVLEIRAGDGKEVRAGQVLIVVR